LIPIPNTSSRPHKRLIVVRTSFFSASSRRLLGPLSQIQPPAFPDENDFKRFCRITRMRVYPFSPIIEPQVFFSFARARILCPVLRHTRKGHFFHKEKCRNSQTRQLDADLFLGFYGRQRKSQLFG